MVSPNLRFRPACGAAAGLCLLLGLAGISCSSKAQDEAALKSLNEVVAAYEHATSYADSGEVHFRVKPSGGKIQEIPPFPLSVTYERPNKLRLHANQVIVVCDGKDLRATVPDRPDQVVQIDAPSELTFTNLFADPMLRQALRENVGQPLIPLCLLLNDDPLRIARPDAQPPRRLEDAELDGETCQRIVVPAEKGDTVYWIDPEKHLVKRVDFPTGEIKKQMFEKMDGEIELWAEYKGARLNEPIAEHAFEFETPKNALLLNRFIGPKPEAPPQWLGARLRPFSFTDLAGKPVDLQSLAGRITVLDFWATFCGPCMVSLPHLQQTYDHFKDNPQINILAVSIDAPEVADAKLEDQFKANHLSIPIVRDTEHASEKVFGISAIPTTVILGADGTIQSVRTGFTPEMAAQLTPALDHLIEGGDFAKEAYAEYNARLEQFQKELKEALIGKLESQEIPEVKIAERSDPKAISLTKLWTAAEVPHPGNLTVIAREGASQTLAFDGDRSVVELDGEGKVTARHDLDIPEMTAVNFLRTTVDGEGHRYFLAFAVGGQQFHLFDSDWKKLQSFPADQHAGLGDVEFADLEGKGQPAIYVGYWGDVGVQCVSFAGERVWSNRELDNVFHLAATAPDADGNRSLLCANGAGTLVELDHEGKKQRELHVADHGLSSIVAAESAHTPAKTDAAAKPASAKPAAKVQASADGQVAAEADAPVKDAAKPEPVATPEKPGLQLCGLSIPSMGKTVALGLRLNGAELEERWTYNLPDGLQHEPVETIVYGHLSSDDKVDWLFPGVDGSIHILNAEGDLLDQFNYGSLITGLAVTSLGDDHVLLVASTEGLTAWKVTPKDEAPADEPTAKVDSAANNETDK